MSGSIDLINNAIFYRLIGFFFLSPLFNWLNLSFYIRFALIIALGLFFTPLIAPFAAFSWVDLCLELSLGYLIGLALTVIFEAIALAGEWVGTMMGLSTHNLFSSFGQLSLPLISRALVLLGATLFFVLDFHHLFIRLLFQSYHLLPLGFTLSLSSLLGFIHLGSEIFLWAFNFAFLPLSLLLLFLLFLALLARLYPQLNFLSIGFPLQLTIGLYALTLLLTHFPENFSEAFFKINSLVVKTLVP